MIEKIQSFAMVGLLMPSLNRDSSAEIPVRPSPQETMLEKLRRQNNMLLASIGGRRRRKQEKIKEVRFSSENQVNEVLHLNNYTAIECHNTWYSETEYEYMQWREMAQLRSVLKRGIPVSPNFTLRGLEKRTKKGALKRQENKEQGWSSVLHEQELQRLEGVCDAQMIRMMYMKSSMRCQREAEERGDEDAWAAIDALE
mmetsp:Transcript_32980/g.46833  ORF Transcript_32980/g.46833 Transcript_32980/m.46833 type:complete len:199 (+) Transcript_32980:70-666(+)